MINDVSLRYTMGQFSMGWVLFVPVILLMLIPAKALATNWDFINKDTEYRIGTYAGHNDILRLGNVAVDLNIGAGNNDEGTPLYAPENGSITVVSAYSLNCYETCAAGQFYGMSIDWNNTAGTETIFIAHLQDIVGEGLTNIGDSRVVRAGELIGHIGNTGNSSAAHLHLESSLGYPVLSGVSFANYLDTSLPDSNHVSKGPGSCVIIYGASASTPTTFEYLKFGFGLKNKCGVNKTIQNVAVSFHEFSNPDNFIQTCYKPNPEISTIIADDATQLFPKTSCNIPKGNLSPKKYKLRYKVKYDGTWYQNVHERDIEILKSYSAPSILSFVPAILAGIKVESPLCPIEKIVGVWDVWEKTPDNNGLLSGPVERYNTYLIRFDKSGVAFFPSLDSGEAHWTFSRENFSQKLRIILYPGTNQITIYRDIYQIWDGELGRQEIEDGSINSSSCNSIVIENTRYRNQMHSGEWGVWAEGAGYSKPMTKR